METIVRIKWDKPEEKNWLCPANIELALSSYCMNTKFEVSEIEPPFNEMLTFGEQSPLGL